MAVRSTERYLDFLQRSGGPDRAHTIAGALHDSCLGSSGELAQQPANDTAVGCATDLMVQVYPIIPGHRAVLRSIELFATKVAPQLGRKSTTMR